MRKRTIALLLAFTMMLSLFTPLPAYAEDEANDAPNLELGAPEGTDDVDSETCTHEYGDWIIDTEPQVGTDGLKHRECALCGNTESEVIPPLKEDETSEENVPPADTETPPAQPDPAPGKEVCDHEYGEWQLRKEPTMDEAGSQFRVCQLCGEEEEERIPALSEITNGEGPHGDGVVYCPHGHVKGEICYECGALTHSDKNIPMLGYDMDFFAQHMPPEDVDEEDLILYNLFSCRLICRHGVADGLYCDACGGLVNVQAEDIPSCWWFDSCMHGKIRGEKCPECQELKESQGDYELMEGEEWSDPLIYGTETMKYVSDISYIFNLYRYCIWCDDGNRIGVSRLFNDAWNVLCHVDSNGKYHWDYINRVEGSGTCSSHDTTIVYNCGARERSVHHSNSCKYDSNKTEHTDILSNATCQSEGKKMTYYTAKCSNCGSEGPATDKKTVSIPKLPHLYTDATYLDSENHLANCSGNNTAAHQDTVKHTFTQTGEDYHCSDCDAAKTTVHIDVCSKDGTVLKADLLASLTVEVGHNGPASVSIADYTEDAYKAAVASGFVPLEDQNSEETVQLGGVHLKYYCNQITSIEVKDHKETYYRTDDFVDQGTIIVHYLDGTTEEVPLVKDKVTDGFDTSTVGTKTLTVTHNGMSTTCDIEVLWIPAKIKVEVPEGYAQSKLGTIVITGDGDFVTMPDGSTVPCGEVDTYLFTENGDFPFIVTGMDKGTDTDTVHMDLIDTEAPILTAELKDGKLTISSYDDLSGLKDITYLEATDTTAEPLQHIGEENKKTLEVSVDGVADGVYRIVATDHAGNSRNFDIAINVEAEPDNTPFSMYVPSSISFYVDKEGAVTYIPDDTQIYNYPGEKPISIKAITVSALNDWTLVDYDTDFSQYEKDSAYVALSINGNKVNANGTVQINVEDWVIAEQSSLPLVLDIKVPAQSEGRELPSVLKLNFTGDWYNEGDVVGQKQLITIMEDENCSYSPNVTAIYTNNFGKITYLPRVIVANNHCQFVKWIDISQVENINDLTNDELMALAEVKVGQVITNDMIIKPVLDSDLEKELEILESENGNTGDIKTVKTTIFGKIKNFPATYPAEDYKFDHWENQSGEIVDENTVFDSGDMPKTNTNGFICLTSSSTVSYFLKENAGEYRIVKQDGNDINYSSSNTAQAEINGQPVCARINDDYSIDFYVKNKTSGVETKLYARQPTGIWFSINTGSDLVNFSVEIIKEAIRPIFTLDYDLVADNPNYVRIDFSAGEGGSISGEAFTYVKKDTAWKNITKPVVSTYEKYRFVRWITTENLKLNDDRLITKNIVAVAQFERIIPPFEELETSNFNPNSYYTSKLYKNENLIVILNTNNEIYYSYDSINWTKTSYIGSKGFSFWGDEFCTVDYSYIYKSSNKNNFTKKDCSSLYSYYDNADKIAYGNNILVVSFSGSNAENSCGVIMAKGTTLSNLSGITPISQFKVSSRYANIDTNVLKYIPEGKRFYIARNSMYVDYHTTSLYTSTDGITWKETTCPSKIWTDVEYDVSSGTYYALGRDRNNSYNKSANKYTLYASTDGLNFKEISSYTTKTTSASYNGNLACGNGVVMINFSPTEYCYSRNMTEWKRLTIPSDITPIMGNCLEFFKGNFITVIKDKIYSINSNDLP